MWNGVNILMLECLTEYSLLPSFMLVLLSSFLCSKDCVVNILESKSLVVYQVTSWDYSKRWFGSLMFKSSALISRICCNSVSSTSKAGCANPYASFNFPKIPKSISKPIPNQNIIYKFHFALSRNNMWEWPWGLSRLYLWLNQLTFTCFLTQTA